MLYDGGQATEAYSKMFRFLFGLVVGVVAVPLAVLAWFSYGKVPVAVTDKPFPYERELTSVPLNTRIHEEMMGTHLQADENTLIAGARVYTEQCAVCHGVNGKPSAIGAHMFPGVPQLMEKHHNGDVVGVSDDPPGETYWKVANGIRLTGMPSFRTLLSDDQMWQVSILLANANKPMPPAALDILRRAPAPPAAAATPAAPASAAPAAPQEP
jgi:thiosulfate dehydrogenase